MKKVRWIAISAFSVILGGVFAQSYTAHGYANGVIGARYQMPGKTITSASALEVDQPDVVTCYYYDIANISGPNLKADTAVTFGIYTQGSASDGGGQNKRGYNTTADAATAKFYAPIRWNGGSNLWRQGGQWVRYSIDFKAGSYNFIYRANVNSFAIPFHKFTLKIFNPSNLSAPLFERVIDLSGTMPVEGAVGDNILRMGGGNVETDWFKLLDGIDLSAGTYVVELSSPAISYSQSSWGVFTFNKASGYTGKPLKEGGWNATGDTIGVMQYDKVGDNMNFANGDSGITVGVYNILSLGGGENSRQYTDNPHFNAVRFNAAKNTIQSNGAWYKYTLNFSGKLPYWLTFKGLADSMRLLSGAKVTVVEPATETIIAEYALDSNVEDYPGHEGEPVRWMYNTQQAVIPAGKYVVMVDFPLADSIGFFSAFSFSDENPENKIPKVTTFNWPQTVAADNNLHSNLYTVKVHQNGKVYDMFMHKSVPDIRPSKYPDDNGGNGVMNELYDRTFNFCQFEFTDEIIVEATKVYGTVASRVEIQPKAYGINPFYFDGRTVKFKIRHQEGKPNYISINFVSNDNLDNQPISNQKAVKHGLVLFADKPEVHKPDTTQAGTVFYHDNIDSASVVKANLIYFRPGDWNLKKVFKRGVIDLTKNGQHIYLEGGAYVRGAIWSRGKHNIWLYGRGIITGWDMLFHELLDANGKKEAFMAFYQSDDCHIEGISIVDPTHHSIPTRSRSYFKNVKIIGWSYNQDGTRVGAGSHIEEMFTKTQDDRSYADRNHVYKNSVEWPMRNGAFAVLGWGSYDGGNSTYDNIYFINSEWERPEAIVGNQAVLGSRIKQGSNQQGVTMRNFSLEDYTTLLCILRIHYEPTEGDPWKPTDPGVIKNFLFENITLEQPFIMTDGTKKYNRIEGFTKDGVKAQVHDITFRNLVAGSELVLNHNKSKYFYIDPNTTYNIKFEAVGDVHTIRATHTSGGNVYPKGNIAVPDGTNRYVSIEPNSGYYIKDVKVDYQSVGPLSVVQLNNVTSDHVIEVEFAAGSSNIDLTEVVDPNTVLSDTINLGVNHLGPGNAIHRTEYVNTLRVFPNPSNTTITVANSKEGTEKVIFNHLGQEIHRTTLSVIDVTAFKPGIYILLNEGMKTKFMVR